jgi:alpha-tubulin suppressor-like RCC1 family protein
VAVSAGAFHSLALRSDGTVYGWGDNLHGMVTGTPLLEPRITNGLVKLDGQVLSNVVSVVAGREWSLALKQDGTVSTWGENYVPSGLSDIIGIAVDSAHCWVLKSNGTVVGWYREPAPHYGLLTADSLSNVMAIAVGPAAQGQTRGVALKRDGTVTSWGLETTDPAFTAPPAGLSNVVAIAAGASHTLALKSDGTVVGWGWNATGEATGTPTTNSSKNLDFISAGQVRVAGHILSDVVSIAAGSGYSMALKKDGTVVAWGCMLGPGYPVNVPEGLHGVVAIAAGWDDFCLAITTNKEVAERFRH